MHEFAADFVRKHGESSARRGVTAALEASKRLSSAVSREGGYTGLTKSRREAVREESRAILRGLGLRPPKMSGRDTDTLSPAKVHAHIKRVWAAVERVPTTFSAKV